VHHPDKIHVVLLLCALMAVVVVGRSDDALTALVVFLVAYAVGQLAAFAVVTGLRGRTSIADYTAMFARRPLLAAILTAAMLSFVGIPPLAGFTGKLLLFEATMDGGYAWLAVLAVANSVGSLFYYLRVVAPMSFDLANASETPVRKDVVPVPVLGQWALVGAMSSGSQSSQSDSARGHSRTTRGSAAPPVRSSQAAPSRTTSRADARNPLARHWQVTKGRLLEDRASPTCRRCLPR
jgi:NADH:ubiquinone oxidoreductase subunit 5 (subunit L)/multisubunit Na+/H+ antiporter MnhA subunit